MTKTTIKTTSDPRRLFEKIVVNAGVGKASGQQPNFPDKVLPQIQKDLSLICAQQPQPRPARKSIAGFKMREGQVIGLRITLRRQKMVDFFNRLITIVLPRVRDFNGIDPGAVDSHGILNIGLREQFVFPEINPEESSFTFSMGLNIVPRKKDRKEALAIYQEMGIPFKKK